MDGQEGDRRARRADAREAEDLLLQLAPIIELLRDLVDLAASRLHASCALTLRSDRQLSTAASSDGRAEAMSDWQHTHVTGPSLGAISDGRPAFFVDSPASRWPDYARFAAQHGVASSMSMPLVVDATTVGALTAHRELPEGFTPAQQEIALTFAARAAGAVALVFRIARRADLSTAVADRSLIDTAVGILMARGGEDERQALAALRADAAARSVTVARAAVDIVSATQVR